MPRNAKALKGPIVASEGIRAIPQLSAQNKIIDDPTDPGGTLRPNLPPKPTTNTEFKPLPHPKFDYKINLPTYVNATNPITI